MMFSYDGRRSSEHNQGEILMKKLMSVMLGLTLFLGVVTISFAQDGDKKTDEGKKKGKKKKGTDAPRQ
jgi:hypothetical protein